MWNAFGNFLKYNVILVNKTNISGDLELLKVLILWFKISVLFMIVNGLLRKNSSPKNLFKAILSFSLQNRTVDLIDFFKDFWFLLYQHFLLVISELKMKQLTSYFQNNAISSFLMIFLCKYCIHSGKQANIFFDWQKWLEYRWRSAIQYLLLNELKFSPYLTRNIFILKEESGNPRKINLL